MSDEHTRDFFLQKQKKVVNKNPAYDHRTCLEYFSRLIFFFREQKIHLCFRTCVELFVLILRIGDSPRKSDELAWYF